MTKRELKKQAKNIQIACRENGISDHIIWISKNNKINSDAAIIAANKVEHAQFPAHISFMFCNDLEFIFFYSNRKACVSYAGLSSFGSADMDQNIVNAFQKARNILKRMQELEDKKDPI